MQAAVYYNARFFVHMMFYLLQSRRKHQPQQGLGVAGIKPTRLRALRN